MSIGWVLHTATTTTMSEAMLVSKRAVTGQCLDRETGPGGPICTRSMIQTDGREPLEDDGASQPRLRSEVQSQRLQDIGQVKLRM